ncbi:MAG: DUF4450 domain-containing protein, partial [Muribaculaceae bacterium]|nr:DUF4450 domain-containing protein [Muribaculaceae bacterium]
AYTRHEMTDRYDLSLHMEQFDSITFRLPARYSDINSVKVNGHDTAWSLISESIDMPRISVTVPATASSTLEVSWAGEPINTATATATGTERTGFHKVRQGRMTWWVENSAEHQASKPAPYYYGLAYTNNSEAEYSPVDMSSVFNASVTDIFRNRYLSPRSPYTTLQQPVQGIGEWCHPLDSAVIDDSFIRSTGGRYITPAGIPFSTPSQGYNVAYTSLYDNYPNSISINLDGKAKALHLMLAGSTNHMQCHMINALVRVEYADGTTTTMPLVPPINWCPIEQDYYADGKAFKIEYNRPQRLALQSGILSDNLERDLGISGVYGRRIPGGAATLLRMPVADSKELKSVTLTTYANEV